MILGNIGLYRDNGKENGNYRDWYIFGIYSVLE